jgi:hypothetical protein
MAAMKRKKTPKRLPVPKKPPKVEVPRTAYDRKRTKREAERLIEEGNSKA